MLFERIESEGLAHYSYLVGRKGEAAVIDPRRDCGIYLERSVKAGHRITLILETHRNEDYLSGSLELAARTGAEIRHADSQWDYRYGLPAHDGQIWEIGGLRLEAVHSPGHTPGHMSYVLHEPEGTPWMLFSGDSLLAGEVGRVDLMGEDRMEEMAGILHDTLFERLLPLGDGVILCPAHGPGSVCGAVISDRSWTTIGLERRLNPRLRYVSRDLFIEKTAEKLEYPPWFERMETLNVQGPPLLEELPDPVPLSPRDFRDQAIESLVLDIRGELGFGASHIPGAFSIWREGLPRFAGWFLPRDRPILLVTDDNDPGMAVRYLVRLGYDGIEGFLAGGMHAWNAEGLESRSNGMTPVQNLCRRIDAGGEQFILDIRSDRELSEDGIIPGAHHIPLTRLPHRLSEISRDLPVYIFCDSGRRSSIAASILQQRGWDCPIVALGGMSGWNSLLCPVEKNEEEPEYSGA